MAAVSGSREEIVLSFLEQETNFPSVRQVAKCIRDGELERVQEIANKAIELIGCSYETEGVVAKLYLAVAFVKYSDADYIMTGLVATQGLLVCEKDKQLRKALTELHGAAQLKSAEEILNRGDPDRSHGRAIFALTMTMDDEAFQAQVYELLGRIQLVKGARRAGQAVETANKAYKKAKEYAGRGIALQPESPLLLAKLLSTLSKATLELEEFQVAISGAARTLQILDKKNLGAPALKSGAESCLKRGLENIALLGGEFLVEEDPLLFFKWLQHKWPIPSGVVGEFAKACTRCCIRLIQEEKMEQGKQLAMLATVAFRESGFDKKHLNHFRVCTVMTLAREPLPEGVEDLVRAVQFLKAHWEMDEVYSKYAAKAYEEFAEKLLVESYWNPAIEIARRGIEISKLMGEQRNDRLASLHLIVVKALKEAEAEEGEVVEEIVCGFEAQPTSGVVIEELVTVLHEEPVGRHHMLRLGAAAEKMIKYLTDEFQLAWLRLMLVGAYMARDLKEKMIKEITLIFEYHIRDHEIIDTLFLVAKEIKFDTEHLDRINTACKKIADGLDLDGETGRAQVVRDGAKKLCADEGTEDDRI